MIKLILFIQYLTLTEVKSSQWLIEQSFQSKPIWNLRNDFNKFSSSCHNDLHLMLNQTFQTTWAYKMLDANAPITAGLFEDQFTSVGDYKECLSIQNIQIPNVESQENYPESFHQINGKFCFLTFKQTNQMGENEQINQWIRHTNTVHRRFPYAYGICVPDSCSKEELTKLFQNSKEFQKSDFRDIQVKFCQVDERRTTFIEFLRKKNTLIAFPIVCFFIGLALVATLWKIIFPKSNSLIKHFSLVKNTKILFMNEPTKIGTLQHRLSHIHGIRALAMIWVVIGHNSAYFPGSINMILSQVARHPFDFTSLIKESLWSNPLTNGYFALETFFFLSGFLSISVMMDRKVLKIATFKTFWGLRYLRFAIPLLGIIAIHKCFFMLGNGPFNSPEYFNATYRSCDDKHWWKQLFFFNNFGNTSDSCIYFSWYLSADLQIHIFAFLLIIALRKELYKHFYMICLFFGSFTFIIPGFFILSGISTFETAEIFINFESNFSIKSQILLYVAPWTHMATFFYGCAIGLAFMQQKNLFYSRSKFWWNLSLITISIIALSSIPSVENLNSSHLLRAGVIAIVYGLWVFALSIIIYQMSLDDHPKHTKTVRKFLSLPLLKPISRISFSMYLSHFTISQINFVLNDDLLRPNHTQVVRFVFATFLQTILLSWIVYVLVEAPINGIMKDMFSIKKSKEKERLDEELADLNYDKNINNNNKDINVC